MQKCLFTAFIITLFTMSAFGQYMLRGRVTDATTNEPIPYATTYINQTTNGAISRDDGSFEITFQQKNAELVISYLGYEPIIFPIDVNALNKVYVFALTPQTELLNEIQVEAERDDSWYYNLDTFKRFFLGESKAGQSCEILNDTSLIMMFDAQQQRLEVKAREAIVIENPHLGYRIEYVLKHFQYDIKNKYVSFTGYPFFTPLQGVKGKQKRWEKNRRKAYLGSQMHFLRSLYHQTIEEEQFVIQRLKKVPNPERPSQQEIEAARETLRSAPSKDRLDFTKFKKEREIINKMRVPKTIQLLDTSYVNLENYLTIKEDMCELTFENHFQVIYQGEKETWEYITASRKPFEGARKPSFQTSVISLTNGAHSTTISKFGATANPLDILFEGYWAFEKMGDLVPMGYQLSE